jgi:hypothetical protein
MYHHINIYILARAGHAAALDHERNLMWIFGGYTTYYPYLATNAPGSGPGTQADSNDPGYAPYPTYQYYLNDIWYYNFTSEFWTEIKFEPGDLMPAPRFDHIMLLRGEILFVHGGQGDNFFYDDIWYFNLTCFKWLEKKRYYIYIHKY